LALLPLSSTLLLASPALAEEVEEAASEALAAGPGNALALGLVISPILFYAGFSLYRSQIDPRAKFGDAVFAFAGKAQLRVLFEIQTESLKQEPSLLHRLRFTPNL
jgi:hypothetical protein